MATSKELVALVRTGNSGSIPETGHRVEQEDIKNDVDAAVFLFLVHNIDEATKYTSEFEHLRHTLEQAPELGRAHAMQSLVRYGAEVLVNPSQVGVHFRQQEAFWDRAAILTACFDTTGELLGQAIVHEWSGQADPQHPKDINGNEVGVYFKLIPRVLAWLDTEEAKKFTDNAGNSLAYYIGQEVYKPAESKQKLDKAATLAIKEGLKYLAQHPLDLTHGIIGLIGSVDLVRKAKLGDHLQPIDLLEIVSLLPQDKLREALVNHANQEIIAECIIEAARNGYFYRADPWLEQINGLIGLLPDTGVAIPYIYACVGLCLGAVHSGSMFRHPSYNNVDTIEKAFTKFFTTASASLANPLPEGSLNRVQLRDYYQLLWLVRAHKEVKELMHQVAIAEHCQAGFDLVQQVREQPNTANLVPIAAEVSAHSQPQSLQGTLDGVPLWQLLYQAASSDDKTQVLAYIAYAAKSAGITPTEFADFCMIQGQTEHALAHLLENLYEIDAQEVHRRIKSAVDKLIADKVYLTILLYASKLSEQYEGQVRQAKKAFREEIITRLGDSQEEIRKYELTRLKKLKENDQVIYFNVAVGILRDRQVAWMAKRALVNHDPELAGKLNQEQILRLLYMEKPGSERIEVMEKVYFEKLTAKKAYGKLLEAASKGVISDILAVAENVTDLSSDKFNRITQEQIVNFFRRWLDLIVSRKTGITLTLNNRERACLKKWNVLAGQIPVLIGLTIDEKYKDVFEALKV